MQARSSATRPIFTYQTRLVLDAAQAAALDAPERNRCMPCLVYLNPQPLQAFSIGFGNLLAFNHEKQQGCSRRYSSSKLLMQANLINR